MWECKSEIEDQLKEITNIKSKLQFLKHKAIDNEQATSDLGYGYLAFLSLISRIEISLSWWEEELNKKLEGEDIKEIPQFEGTLEQLDKLSIRGDKE